MADDFFGTVRPWSRHKHEILQKYLHPWVSKLQSVSPTLVYVDACAGAGSYQSGEDGSPLIAARWNERWLRERGKRLLVIAIEQSDELVGPLRESLAAWSSRVPPEAMVLEGRFERHIGQLVEVTSGLPRIFFIDPFGTKGIEPDTLAPLLEASTLRYTELLLRVDPGLFARASGWRREKERNSRGRRTAQGFARLLERLRIPDEVLTRLEALEAEDRLWPGERAARLLDAYTQLFEQRFNYVQLIPIRASYYAAPRYFLLHATNSPDGASKINDVVSTTEDSLFVRSVSQRDETVGQGSLFTPTAAERWMNAGGFPRVTIEEAVQVAGDLLGKRDGPCRLINLSADLAIAFGPDLRMKEHRQVAQLLRDRGRLTWDGKLTEKTWLRLC